MNAFTKTTLFAAFAALFAAPGCYAPEPTGESESDEVLDEEALLDEGETGESEDALKLGAPRPGGGGGLLNGGFGYTCSDPGGIESKPTCSCSGTEDCARMGSRCKKDSYGNPIVSCSGDKCTCDWV